MVSLATHPACLLCPSSVLSMLVGAEGPGSSSQVEFVFVCGVGWVRVGKASFPFQTDLGSNLGLSPPAV